MGKTVFNKDLTYVALSRCKKFKGIIMVNMDYHKFQLSLNHDWDRV